MKEKPIIFSDPMVRAILEDRKTQTRRIIKKVPKGTFAGDTALYEWANCLASHGAKTPLPSEIKEKVQQLRGHIFPFRGDHGRLSSPSCQYGWPGSRLWVRETWNAGNPAHPSGMGIMFNMAPQEGMKVIYRADEKNALYIPPLPWRPSIFMPRWASRITLEITDVRVQRLQEISEQDAVAEGVVCNDGSPFIHGLPTTLIQQPREEFMHLWDSINAERGYDWNSNPWVWSISFRRIDTCD